MRTAREVVVRYLDVLYNQRRLDLIPELISDPTWRHKAGEVKSLSLAETATIEHYERCSGRRLGDLRWFRQYSALRMAVLMHRFLRAMVHAERMPAEHRLLSETVATRRLVDARADALSSPGG